MFDERSFSSTSYDSRSWWIVDVVFVIAAWIKKQFFVTREDETVFVITTPNTDITVKTNGS